MASGLIASVEASPRPSTRVCCSRSSATGSEPHTSSITSACGPCTWTCTTSAPRTTSPSVPVTTPLPSTAGSPGCTSIALHADHDPSVRARSRTTPASVPSQVTPTTATSAPTSAWPVRTGPSTSGTGTCVVPSLAAVGTGARAFAPDGSRTTCRCSTSAGPRTGLITAPAEAAVPPSTATVRRSMAPRVRLRAERTGRRDTGDPLVDDRASRTVGVVAHGQQGAHGHRLAKVDMDLTAQVRDCPPGSGTVRPGRRWERPRAEPSRQSLRWGGRLNRSDRNHSVDNV